MIKLDFHTNLGTVPNSANKSSQEIYISPERLGAFLNKFEITHAVVLYTDYKELEELDELCPNTEIYGLRWINDINGCVKDPENMLDIGKRLWRGVKFHSHRSYRMVNGEKEYGTDYSDSRLVGKILDLLPDNSIICMHTQGSASLHNQATPRAIYKLAMLYPNLKFIISHAGAYGKGAYDPVPRYFPPVTRKEQSQEQKAYQAMRTVFHFSEMLIRDAVYLVNRIPNLFLNTSVLYPLKRIPLQHTDRWGIGSDFPFTSVTPTRWDDHSYDAQVQLANNYVGEDKQRRSHEITLHWINSDICKVKKKKWVALFSKSGSEILSLINHFGFAPDLIVTTKTQEEFSQLDLSGAVHIDSVKFLSKECRVKEYIDILTGADINPGWDVITLHGFLKIIPSRIVNRYPMINLHPGLISKYPELKGLNPQKRLLENIDGFEEYGCVLHEVIKDVDEGRIISESSRRIHEMISEDEIWDGFSEMALKLWIEYLTDKLNVCELAFAEQAVLENQH